MPSLAAPERYLEELRQESQSRRSLQRRSRSAMTCSATTAHAPGPGLRLRLYVAGAGRFRRATTPQRRASTQQPPQPEAAFEPPRDLQATPSALTSGAALTGSV